MAAPIYEAQQAALRKATSRRMGCLADAMIVHSVDGRVSSRVAGNLR